MRPSAESSNAAAGAIHRRVDPSTLHVPAVPGGMRLDPDRTGFRYCGLHVVHLGPGDRYELDTREREWAVVPIEGDVELGLDRGRTWSLVGRDGVFDAVPDVAAIGRSTPCTVFAGGNAPAVVALPWAYARADVESEHIRAVDVPVEVRGAGAATRQLNNLFAPGAGPFDRLTVVEGLVPGGNWASWPPHKHDAPVDGEAVLEEIYWFQVRGDGGWAAHRTYDLEERWDVTATIHDGDAFLVPRGYHGPEMAAPGHDLYFLNVLAGPAAERSLAFSDDPAHADVRRSWETMERDPRVPLTRAVTG